MIASLIISPVVPLLVSVSTATASETFNSYPTTSSYVLPPAQTTVAGGVLWYVEGTHVPWNYIGSLTTSGTITDHYIAPPTGFTSFGVSHVTTGPDGNVWFDGCADSSSLFAGSFNVSTGAVTFYQNTQLASGCGDGATPGPIATGPDGNVWYTLNGSNYTDYLFYVKPSTGATSTGWQGGDYEEFTSMTTGPDGRLWLTDGGSSLKAVLAFTVSSGSATWTGEYFTSGVSPLSVISGPDGNMWFSEGNAIVKSTTSGSFTKYTLPSGVSANTLATGPDGAVWFSGGSVIGRITTTGNVTTYTVPVPSGYTSVSSFNLALGSDNAMWFGYQTNGFTYGVGRIGY